MLIEGSILAVIVIGLFLKDWRTTVIGAVALPLSIIPTFAAMHWLGFTLNGVTLLALAVIVGVLVDDAVVEVENIARHMQMGKSIHDATIDAVNEIAVAVLGTTATLVVVFLPTSMMSGVAGMVFSQFGWTLVIAVLMSLVVARMVTPVMAIWMLKPVEHKVESGLIMERYLQMVEWCLQHRRITVIVSGLIFFISISLVSKIPTAFMPAEDNGLITLSYELPAGSSIEETYHVSETIRHRIKDIEGIDSTFTSIGSSSIDPSNGPSSGVMRKGTLDLLLSPRGQRPSQQVIEALVKQATADVAGARISFASAHPGEKMLVLLAGDDAKLLRESAQKVEQDLRALPYLSGFTSSATLDRSEMVITPNMQLMADQGITTQDIGDTIRIALSGDYDQALSKLNLETRQLYVRVRLPENYQKSIEKIGQIMFRG